MNPFDMPLFESMMWLTIYGAAIILVLTIILLIVLSPEQKTEAFWGKQMSMLKCPHCGTTGSVRANQTTVKSGISGAKATAAILTSGASLPVTGLSSKHKATQLTCHFCKMTWTVA
jgi:hypothetical protein